MEASLHGFQYNSADVYEAPTVCWALCLALKRRRKDGNCDTASIGLPTWWTPQSPWKQSRHVAALANRTSRRTSDISTHEDGIKAHKPDH